jgi:hypothetical protein
MLMKIQGRTAGSGAGRGEPVACDGVIGVLKSHKFTVGQTVRYIAGPLNRATADGTFKIVKLLPPDGDEHQYRIKNTEEAFERVAKESQLDRHR